MSQTTQDFWTEQILTFLELVNLLVKAKIDFLINIIPLSLLCGKIIFG